MKHWLKGVDWLQPFFERRKDVWFDWLSESNSKAHKEEVFGFFEETPFDFLMPPLMLEMARERVARCVPIATGAEFPSYDLEIAHQPIWWFDPAEPDKLFLALSDSFPPYFWIPVEPTDEAVETVIRANFVTEPGYIWDMHGSARLLAGGAEELQMELENFENHYTMTAPCSTHMWGSEWESDPWPADSRHYSQIDRIKELRRTMQQREGRVRRTSFRTTWSRSVVTVEDYDGVFVFDLRYHPQTQNSHVEQFNQKLGARYPVDAPVDVLAAITGFRNVTGGEIIQALDAGDYEFLGSDLATLGLLEPNALELERRLAGWIETAESPEIRMTMTQFASQFQLTAFLCERWAKETDPEILAALGDYLRPTQGV